MYLVVVGNPLLHDPEQVLVCISAMNDQRLPQGHGQLQLLLENLFTQEKWDLAQG